MTALPFVAELLGWKKGKNGTIANVADIDSLTSRKISAALLEALGVTAMTTATGQTAGRMLEQAVADYLAASLPKSFNGRVVEVSRGKGIADFSQYEHLRRLKERVDDDETGLLRASVGADYLVKPDVTVGLDSGVGTPLLHAAVPCKWTIRSDRVQNIRHEAVILIRHRRGRLPHITPVAAEPLPTRLASLARGTAEVDTLYHVALEELTAAVKDTGTAEQRDVLEELVDNDRLRDLSELAGALQL